jgi:hypothetical protein
MARINSLYGHHVFQVVDTVFVLMATHALNGKPDGPPPTPSPHALICLAAA